MSVPGESERVEERQNAKNAVASAERKRLPQLLGVGDDVVVREHHALRIARAAAGENDGGEIVERALLLATRAPSPASATGSVHVIRRGSEFFAEPRLLGEFFEQDCLPGHGDLDLLQEFLRRDDGLQSALARARGDDLIIGGVIEIHGHFAHQQRGVIHERAADGRRQENADHFLSCPNRAEPSREEDGARQRRTESQFRNAPVGHEEPPRMMAGLAHERAVDRHHQFLAMLPRLGVEFLHGLAHFKRSRGRRHRFAEADGHGIGDVARHFPEEASLLEAEDAAPHVVETHGNDRRVHVLHHPLEAAPEREQLADARDLSLGEDAHDVAVLDRLAGGAQRLDHLARTQLRRNRDGLHRLGERFHERKIVNALEHDRANHAVGGTDDEQRVHERHVIAHEQRAAFLGNVVASLDPQPIDRMRERPHKQPQQRVGHET